MTTQKQTPANKLLTIKEYAAKLKCKPQNIYNKIYRKTNKFQFIRKGSLYLIVIE